MDGKKDKTISIRMEVGRVVCSPRCFHFCKNGANGIFCDLGRGLSGDRKHQATMENPLYSMGEKMRPSEECKSEVYISRVEHSFAWITQNSEDHPVIV